MDEKHKNIQSEVSRLPSKNDKRDSYLFGLFDAREKSLIPLQIVAIVLAIVEAAQGINNIVNPESETYAHTFAHLGSYTLAYSAALFVVGFKPARARGLLILFVVATFGFLATSIFDIFRGNAALATELQHITKLIPPIVVWLIAQRAVHKFQIPK